MLLPEYPWLLSQGMKGSVKRNTSAEPTPSIFNRPDLPAIAVSIFS
ncbi:MAG: hypothetical protein Q7K65_00965 [Candidatus Buchananbacteria bacterium]|nr:hypothetical protein [Candidatus Buchananbacteria bacterium]